MTFYDKLDKLKTVTGETDESVLSAYLEIAQERILQKLYPFKALEAQRVPDRYENTQIEIAAYLFNKRGAEGETSHNENGVNRTYESASVPDSMLKHIVPYVGVI